VPGAGASEIELGKEIASYGEKCPGLAQYAIQKFAESLEQLPRAIAVNAGVKVVLSRHSAAPCNVQRLVFFTWDSDNEFMLLKY